VLVLAGIDDPKLDSTTSHPSSLSHSLTNRCRLLSRAPCADDYGWFGSTASVHVLRLLLLSLSDGQQFVSVSATVTALYLDFCSSKISFENLDQRRVKRKERRGKLAAENIKPSKF